MWTFNYSNEMYHYGVKGMKWGVRKDRGYSYKVNNGRLTIKKGSNLHRITARPDESNSGYLYAAFTPKDVKHYQKSMSSYLTSISESHTTKVYDMSLKVKKDLVAPSEKEKVDTFLELMKDKKIYDEVLKSYENRVIESDHEQFRFVTLSNNLKKSGMPPEICDCYAAFSMGLYNSEKLRSSFFSKLKDQGFDMVVDTEDKYIEAEAPIIVFNRSEATKKLSVSELPAKWSEGWYKLREEEKNTKASKLATEI